jgi:hypothetical protein
MAKSATVQIITKWGNSKPTSLAKGELAVDLNNQILYTFDGLKIIEVGGGTVDWGNIDPDTIPDEITNILDGTINIGDLDALAQQNAAAIIQLNSDLTDLAARVTQNEKDISTNADGIQENVEAIEALGGRVGKNEGDIKDNAADIEDLEKNQVELDGRVTQNEDDIEALKGIVDGDLTGLVLGGTYDVPSRVVADTTAAGDTALINVGDSLDVHAKEENKGMYFVCQGSGELGGLKRESSNGKYAQNGDWLVCDGIHGWILMAFGGDHVTWGAIGGTLSNQTDLQEALDTKLEEGDTLDGGRF